MAAHVRCGCWCVDYFNDDIAMIFAGAGRPALVQTPSASSNSPQHRSSIMPSSQLLNFTQQPAAPVVQVIVVFVMTF
jgi:hypothetical protein